MYISNKKNENIGQNIFWILVMPNKSISIHLHIFQFVSYVKSKFFKYILCPLFSSIANLWILILMRSGGAFWMYVNKD